MRSLFEYGLDAVDIAVAVALLTAVKPGRFGPSQAVLASMVGDKSTRSIQRSLAKIEKAGLFEVVKRGANRVNRYEIGALRLAFSQIDATWVSHPSQSPTALDATPMSPECYTPALLAQVPFGGTLLQSTPENVASTLPRHFAAGIEVQTIDQMMTLFHDGDYGEIVPEVAPFGPPPVPSRARDEIAMVLLEVIAAFDAAPYQGDLGDLIAEYGVERVWYHANWLAMRLTHASSVENVCGFFKRSVQSDWERPRSAYISLRA